MASAAALLLGLTPIMWVAYPAAARCCATVTSSIGSTFGTESEKAVWIPVWMTYLPVMTVDRVGEHTGCT